MIPLGLSLLLSFGLIRWGQARSGGREYVSFVGLLFSFLVWLYQGGV